MQEENEQSCAARKQSDTGTPERWEFGKLIDSEAETELRAFYGALKSSENCKTILVGYTPPKD